MDDHIDTLIKGYATSDSGRRSTIIETLSDSSDPRVISLFVKTVRNPKEADYVRVEVLKGIAFRDDSVETKQRFCDVLCDILDNSEEDELVRQYAALAIRCFVKCEGILGLLEEIVRNPDEEISVRHNALSSIERNAEMTDCLARLKRLVSVPVIGKSAARTLERVLQGGPGSRRK
jgi:hypothetical protein